MSVFQSIPNYRNCDAPSQRLCDGKSHHDCDMETLGERIKRLRDSKGYSQGELGKLIGAGQSTISTLEKDGRTTRPDLILLAHALGVDAYYLKTGVETLLCGDSIIHEVANLMKRMDREGKVIVLDKARDMEKQYPKQSEAKAA